MSAGIENPAKSLHFAAKYGTIKAFEIAGIRLPENADRKGLLI
jgi:hypothetical protein